ncbi:MAG: DUF2384 domain-containing protein [Acidobacteria bacterium]|nr:DUF2384 domain-containing protein [Acidobacteriota bacterium]
MVLRVYNHIASRLEIDPEELACKLSAGTSQRCDWLGCFIGIYEISGRLTGDPVGWLKSPNHAPLFGGRAPLLVLLADPAEKLQPTLDYLNAVYGGWA